MAKYCPLCKKTLSIHSRTCSYCSELPVKNSAGNIFGSILKNRYKIKELIKIGGMGAVYSGEDTETSSKIAIKILFGSQTKHGDSYFITRFHREAELLSRLIHSNLPRVYDYFNTQDNYFIIMDYVQGKDLEHILKEEGNPGLSEEKVIEWAIQISSVLDYLHNYNPQVIYRDIKPSNIIIRTGDEKAILIDFGLARPVTDGVSGGKTAIGTVGYSPPEQYDGRLKPQSDIYALGATLHHILTGKFPQIPFNFPPIRKINQYVSPEVERIVMKALEFDIENRFSSATEMREALKNIKPHKYVSDTPLEEKKTKAVGGKEPGDDSELSEGHSMVAILYAKKGFYNIAKKEMKKAVKLAPKSALAHSNLGYIELHLGNYEKAIMEFKKAIELDPSLASAYCNSGVVYSRMGKYEEAIKEFEKALHYNRNLAEARVNIAHIYGIKNDYREMMEQCKKAIRIQPDNIEAYVNFSYACGKAGLYEDGIMKLEKALNFEDSNEILYSNLGVLYGETKNYDKAIECFNRSISLKPDFPLACSNMGVVFYKKGDYKKAKENFIKAIKIDPDFLQAKANLSKFCEEQNLSKKEYEEIKELLSHGAEDNKPLQEQTGFSSVLMPQNEIDENIADLKVIQGRKEYSGTTKRLKAEAELYSRDPEVYVKLGNHYLEREMFDEAEKEYREALRIKDDHMDALYNLGLIYEKKGLTDLAELEYKKVIKYYPNHFKAYFSMGSIFFERKELEESRKFYLKALNADKNSSELYYRIGLLYKEMEMYKEAIAAFQSCLAIDKKNPEAFFNMGLIYYKTGKFNKSEECFNKALNKKVDYGEAHLYLGNLYYKKKMLDHALKHYKEAIDLKPDYAVAYSNLGAVYSDLDIFDKGEQCYLKAIEIDRFLADAHLNLGVLYQKKKDYKKAVKELEIYLSLSDAKDAKSVRERIIEMNRQINSF